MLDNISPVVIKKINAAALAEYPREMCGFIVGDDFVQVKNTHEDPKESFRVEQDVWREFALGCTAFIHSHPDWYPVPSEKDMQQQSASAIPWGIIGTDGSAVTPIQFFGDQVDKTPIFAEDGSLNIRPFCHGVTDCYDLIRDWYKETLDIELKQIPRSWEWWEKDEDLYKDNFKPVGFSVVSMDKVMEEGPQVGDVFLATVGARTNKMNHGGVYVGDGLGLHHLAASKPLDITRIAKRDPLARWGKYITMWLRYDEKDSSSREA